MRGTLRTARPGGNALTVAAMLVCLAATLEGAAWKIEAVDTSGPGRYSSMQIDKDGNVHVAYVVSDGNRLPLKYAFWDRQVKRWFVMPLAEGAGTCSLALDSKQHPHISWADGGSAEGAKLRHAYWDGASWKKEAVPLNSSIIAYYNSIVVDANDYPSISFYEYRGPKDTDLKIRLRNVMWNGRDWEVRTVDADEGSGKFNSMAVDSQGHIHLAYANVSAVTTGFRYAFWNGKSWKLEIVEPGAVGFSIFIAVDKDGIPHVSYMDEAARLVKYAVRRNGSWRIEVVGAVSGVGYPDRNGLAFDDEGRPYISYYDAGSGLLKVTHRVGEKWQTEIIDGNGAGFSSSMQFDRGVLWISYADDVSGVFKVARAEIGANSSSGKSGEETAAPNDTKAAEYRKK